MRRGSTVRRGKEGDKIARLDEGKKMRGREVKEHETMRKRGKEEQRFERIG